MNQRISRRTWIAGMGAAAISGLPAIAQAQSNAYPQRPIRIVVPWAAGGGSDAIVRAIAPALSLRLGQPVIVDNRPGAIGTIGSSLVARSPADGYTLLFGSADSQSIAPHVLRKSPYDSVKDFVSIVPIGFTPLAFIVHASHPAKTFAQFVQIAHDAKPALLYGSWGIGSSGQITMEALKQALKIDLTHVPYNSTAPLMQAQLAREVGCSIIPALVAEQHAQAGVVRILAINSPDRLPSHPDVPLIRELGVVGLEVSPWLGLLGPAGLPQDVIAKLNTTVAATLSDPQVIEAMRKMSIVLQHMPPTKFQQFTDSEYERWGRYIRTAKILVD